MPREPKQEPDAYVCKSCEELIRPDDAEDTGPLYECGECGAMFTRDGSADGESNRCPDCNRFAAKVAARGCPECGEGELTPLYRSVTP